MGFVETAVITAVAAFAYETIKNIVKSALQKKIIIKYKEKEIEVNSSFTQEDIEKIVKLLDLPPNSNASGRGGAK